MYPKNIWQYVLDNDEIPLTTFAAVNDMPVNA